MITVKAWKSSGDAVVAVEIKGHASFAPHGQDIVCAAASVLTHTTIMAMQSYLLFDPLVKKNQGHLKIVVPDDLDGHKKEQAALLLKTMILGLKETAAAYPGYIKITEVKI